MARTGSTPLWSRFQSSFAGPLWAAIRRLAGRPKFTIGALGIFFALAIALLFLADLRARYRAEIDHASHSAQNYADVLAQHTALTFEAIDRSLREVELIRADLETVLVAIRWTDRSGNYEAWVGQASSTPTQYLRIRLLHGR
jgi:hypothetical protein